MIVIHYHLETSVIVMRHPEVLETVHFLLYADLMLPHVDMVVVLDHLQIVRHLALFMLIQVVPLVDRPHRVP